MHDDPWSARLHPRAGADANESTVHHSARRHASSSTAWRSLLELGGLVVTPDVIVERVALAFRLRDGLGGCCCGPPRELVCRDRHDACAADAKRQQEATALKVCAFGGSISGRNCR